MPLQRRLPKRGFTNIFRTKYQVVNVGDLSRFDAGSVVDPESLAKTRLAGRRLMIKLLADGTCDRPLTVRVHAASGAAKAKIEAAGGRVEILTQVEG